jgi:hypothetical protein
LFASLVLLMAAAKKQKRENALEDVALVACTQQNLSNLYSLDIYADNSHLRVIYMYDFTMRFYIAFGYSICGLGPML